MKIVYYLPSLSTPGGIERVVTFKANYFAENHKDYEVTIITSEQGKSIPYFPLSNKVKHIDINVPFDIPYNQSRLLKIIKYPFRYYLFKKRLSKLLIKLKPDITISTLRREINFLTRITDGSIKIGEFHVTRYEYGAEAINQKNKLVYWIKKYWSRKFISNLSKLEKVVLLTEESAKDFPELSNIKIIPNPISTPIKDKVSDQSSQKVIAIGRYTPQKGFDLLISAWKIVSEKHPDWTLSIYGEGHLKERLNKQIEELQLTKNCILRPTTSNISEKYLESSIFVLSSRYEGLPLVLGEAMIYGLAPVAFACPCGPRDMIKNKYNGLLVKNGDHEELAKNIALLIEDVELRKSIALNAHSTAQRFKMQSIAKQWEQLFQYVISK